MRTTVDVDYATAVTLGASGVVFLLALVLGVWKYEQMRNSPDHLAHPYVDIAHRSSLLYAFATALVAVFVYLSAWPTWLNLAAAMVMVVFFLGAIGSYILHGMLRDTTNQFAHEDPVLRVSMIALMAGEIGGFLVLFAGFIAGRF